MDDPNVPPVTPPAPVEPPAPPAPDPAPPPAAKTVAESPPLDETVKLRSELEEERRLRKGHEIKLSELQDENHRLKRVPAKAHEAGWTLLHGAD